MRISFIALSFALRPVGGYRVIYEYANHLVSRGHEVSIVHPRRVGDSSGSLSYYSRILRQFINWRTVVHPPQKPGWQALDGRVQLIHVPEPTARFVPDADVVFATAWQTAEYVAKYPPSKGKKHYLVMDFYPWIGPREILERTWRLPMKKITISSALRKMVLNAGIGTDEVFNIPIGVDQARFRAFRPFEDRPDRVAMLYANSIYKASKDGVETLERCRAQYPEFEAVVFGPSHRRSEIPSWIEYRGNVPEKTLVKEIYNGCKIYLCSSLFEGFGLPAAEAMACGCAVVSTDCGGVREFASHEETALLSPPGDPEMLAQNLLRLLKDDELQARLAVVGQEKIQAFTWERATDLLEEVLCG